MKKKRIKTLAIVLSVMLFLGVCVGVGICTGLKRDTWGEKHYYNYIKTVPIEMTGYELFTLDSSNFEQNQTNRIKTWHDSTFNDLEGEKNLQGTIFNLEFYEPINDRELFGVRLSSGGQNIEIDGTYIYNNSISCQKIYDMWKTYKWESKNQTLKNYSGGYMLYGVQIFDGRLFMKVVEYGDRPAGSGYFWKLPTALFCFDATDSSIKLVGIYDQVRPSTAVALRTKN